jgi:Primase C terminal 2 (PriCT-2)
VRAPKGRRFRQVLPEYKGLEFRATRGVQCVCPSSIHRDTGLPYRWDRVSEHDPEKWSPEMRERSRLAWEDMGPIRSLLRPAPQALLDLYSEPEETAPLVTRSEAAEPLARLKACLDQLPIRALGKAANNGVGRYTDWGSIGMALHAASGGDPAALALWIEHTKSNPEYAASAEAECTKKWKGFKLDRGSKVGMGTLVRLVQEFGGTVPPPERPSAGDVFDTVPEDEPRAESTNRFAARAIRGPEWVKLPPPPPFVDGLVGGVGVVTLFSPPGTMKTYKALDLGLRTAGALLERARRKAAPEQAAYLDEVREVHRRLEAGWHVANDQGPRRDERLENLRARATERAATATQLGLR